MTGREFSDLILEKYVAGELKGEQRRKLESLLESDESLQLRVSNKLEHNDTFRKSDEYIKILENTQSQLKSPSVNKTRPAVVGFGISSNNWLAQAAVIMVVILAPILIIGQMNDTGIRTKGDSTELEVYTVKPNEQVKLIDGSEIAPGDVLQLRFKTGEYDHAAIFSIDNKGRVYNHFPNDLRASTVVESQQTIYTQHSYEIDTETSYEDFILLLSHNDIDVISILEYAERVSDGEALKKDLGIMYSGMEILSMRIMVNAGEHLSAWRSVEKLY